MLNVFASGGAFWGVTAVAVLLEIIFLYQLFAGQKSGSQQQDLDKGTQYYKEPIKWYKNTFFWLALTVAGLYVFALSQIASDYR